MNFKTKQKAFIVFHFLMGVLTLLLAINFPSPIQYIIVGLWFGFAVTELIGYPLLIFYNNYFNIDMNKTREILNSLSDTKKDGTRPKGKTGKIQD